MSPGNQPLGRSLKQFSLPGVSERIFIYRRERPFGGSLDGEQVPQQLVTKLPVVAQQTLPKRNVQVHKRQKIVVVMLQLQPIVELS